MLLNRFSINWSHLSEPFTLKWSTFHRSRPLYFTKIAMIRFTGWLTNVSLTHNGMTIHAVWVLSLGSSVIRHKIKEKNSISSSRPKDEPQINFFIEQSFSQAPFLPLEPASQKWTELTLYPAHPFPPPPLISALHPTSALSLNSYVLQNYFSEMKFSIPPNWSQLGIRKKGLSKLTPM